MTNSQSHNFSNESGSPFDAFFCPYPVCPYEHPYAFLGGLSCCASERDCKGLRLTLDSDCCQMEFEDDSIRSSSSRFFRGGAIGNTYFLLFLFEHFSILGFLI